jgi:RimJ/RimL family protein N-acetyltransferase
MDLLLRYGFTELNLRRISLTMFEFDRRAVRSYEKAGFQLDGSQRQFMRREGRRWDILYMGILREEWMENYGYNISD